MDNNFSKNIRLLNTILFSSIGIFITAIFWLNGHIYLTMLALFILLASIYIFLSPKAYHLRFMYPGLLTFLLFMILPMIFTIYIAFTNLSTGHFLSLDAAKKVLLEEKYIPEDSLIYSYNLQEKEDGLFVIEVTNKDSKEILTADFTLTQKEVMLSAITQETIIKPLSKGDVFEIKDYLKKISFKTPQEAIITYYRTDLLASQNPLYSDLGRDGLKDNRNQSIYEIDNDKGFFSNHNENINLVPGFHVNVGFKNFKSILTDESIKNSFFKVLTWTLLWAFFTVFLTFSLGLFLALIINDKKLNGKALYRILLIVPYSIPFFISVLIFKGMFNKDFGVINELLSFFFQSKIPWLDNPTWAKISCLTVNLWLGFPYMFLLCTGILQSIPQSIYEAASIDGASRLQKFRHITLPMIFSAIAPLLIGSFAFNLNNFVGIYLLTAGGPPIPGAITPAGETDILISYTYRLAFEGGAGQNFGLASSIAIFIFFIIFAITLVNFKLFGMMKETDKR